MPNDGQGNDGDGAAGTSSLSSPPSDRTYRTVTQTMRGRDGNEFYTKRWLPGVVGGGGGGGGSNVEGTGTRAPRSPPRALLIFVHGFAEHVERYNHVWPRFAERGVEVFAYDQRGFGRSGPAYADTTLGRQLQDIEFAVVQARERLDRRWGDRVVPIYLYGHSMGGGEVITFFTRPPEVRGPSAEVRAMVSGVICSAPWLISANPPNRFLIGMAERGAKSWPNMPWRATLARSQLAEDPSFQEQYRRDPLVSGDVFLKTVAGQLVRGYRILSEEYQNWPKDLPILVMHGENDPATSQSASRAFVEKLQVEDKEFKGWPGMKHEGHNEKGDAGKAFVEYAIKWIEDRTPSSEPASRIIKL